MLKPSKSSLFTFNSPGGNRVGNNIMFLGKTIPQNNTRKHLGHVISTSGNNADYGGIIKDIKTTTNVILTSLSICPPKLKSNFVRANV